MDSVLRSIDSYEPPKNVDAARFAVLKSELKRQLVVRSNGKTLSAAPLSSINAVASLTALPSQTGNIVALRWVEKLPGDYDNDARVDVGDLVPLATYYGQNTNYGPDDAHRLVQGDDEPDISIGDIRAIAENYDAHIEGYQIRRGHWNGTSVDWDANFLPNLGAPAQTGWSVDRPSPPPASSRPIYTYEDDVSGVADASSLHYKVAAYGDGATGAESVTAAAATPRLADTPWPKFQSNAMNTGRSPYVGPQTNSVKWSRTLPFEFAAATVIGPDASLYVSTGGSVYSLSSTDGSPRWKQNLVGWATTPLVSSDGSVLVSSYGASSNDPPRVYALSAADGSVRWTYTDPANSRDFWAPAMGLDGTVYVGALDGKVYALNPTDGSPKWTFTTDAPIRGSAAIGADGTVYIGSCDFKLYALNPQDGTLKWSCTMDYFVEGPPSIGPDGTVYAASSGGFLSAVDPANGAIKWRHQLQYGWPDRFCPAIGADGTLYFGASDGNVYALNPADGSVKWTRATGGWCPGTAIIGGDGVVYITGADGRLYALRAADGSLLWTYAGSGVWDSLTIDSDGTLFAWTPNGNRSATLLAFGGGAPSTYSVGGKATSYGLPLPDVQLTITPGGQTATTQADGTYTFSGIQDGSYTVTPSKPTYAFTPPSAPVTVAGIDVSGVDFTCLPPTHNVSGTVTAAGSPLEDVTVTLSPHNLTATTLADGTFTITTVADGTYVLSPWKMGYVSSPSYRTVVVSGSNVGAQDFAAAPGVGLANSAWPRFGADARNSCLSPSVGPQTDRVKWIRALAHPQGSPPSVGPDGTIYATTYWQFDLDSGGTLYALSPVDGTIRWQREMFSQSSTAVGADGTVYVNANQTYALNPSDGSIIWQSASYSFPNCSPAIAADGTIYVGGFNLYALSPLDGSVKWGATGNESWSSPGIGADGTLFVGFGNTSNQSGVAALNPVDGSIKWTHPTSGYSYFAPLVAADGTVYYATSDGNVYALDPANGSTRQTMPVGSAATSVPAVGTDGTVYCIGGDQVLHALRPDGGDKWSHTGLGANQPTLAIGADGTVFAAGWNGVFALNPVDGSVLWSDSARGYEFPSIGGGGTLYVSGSSDYKYYLYAFGQ